MPAAPQIVAEISYNLSYKLRAISGILLVNNPFIPERLDRNGGVPWHVLHPRKNLITESNCFRKGYCPDNGGIPHATEFQLDKFPKVFPHKSATLCNVIHI